MLLFEKKASIVPFTLTLEKEDVGGLTGQAPTFALRDATSVDSYLDFSGFTFKTSGWTTKYASMTEVERGHYTYFLNLAAVSAISIGDILSAEYYLDYSGVGRVDQETVLIAEAISEIPTDTATLISIVSGALTPTQAAQLKEVWQILGLDPANPLEVSKTSREVNGIIQTIQKNVPFAGHITVTRLP